MVTMTSSVYALFFEWSAWFRSHGMLPAMQLQIMCAWRPVPFIYLLNTATWIRFEIWLVMLIGALAFPFALEIQSLLYLVVIRPGQILFKAYPRQSLPHLRLIILQLYTSITSRYTTKRGTSVETSVLMRFRIFYYSKCNWKFETGASELWQQQSRQLTMINRDINSCFVELCKKVLNLDKKEDRKSRIFVSENVASQNFAPGAGAPVNPLVWHWLQYLRYLDGTGFVEIRCCTTPPS